MAQEEKIIYDIQIPTQETAKELDKLTNQIVDYTDAIKETTQFTKALEDENKDLLKSNRELDKEVKEGTKTREEANDSIEKNRKSIENNNKQIKQNKVDTIGQKEALKDATKERNEASRSRFPLHPGSPWTEE